MTVAGGSKDFISWYLHAVGKSEVPKQFHLWACLSALASAVCDRVWVQREGGWKIYPNLYVFLLGPSGSGKEKAISTAVKLVGEFPVINCYWGMATKQALIDEMGEREIAIPGASGVVRPKMYFVTEELAASIGSDKKMAEELIKFMTQIYLKPPVPITEKTRKWGKITLTDPNMNWLAGSTEEWMVKALGGADAVGGGFFARVIAVRGRRDYATRYPEILYPEDVEEVREYLKWRVAEYTFLEGPFTMTDEATAYRREWYRKRPAPQEQALEPSFNRADEMVHRLALLLRLAEIDSRHEADRTVGLKHLEEAIELWDCVSQDVPHVARLAHATKESTEVEITAEFIRRKGYIGHSELLRKVGGRGMNKDMLKKAIETLVDRGEIKESTGVNRGYTWMS